MHAMTSRRVRWPLLLGTCSIPVLPLQAQGPAADPPAEARTAGPNDVVVTGRSSVKPDAELVGLPITVLTGDELAHRRQGGLGETLAGLPGIHLDNFGGGASRPVIRGQTLPRIEILSDGANVFDASSVSPDHAIGTDPLLLDTIEIQRGPAAVRYGGSAVNGAINLIDSKVPKSIPAGGVTGGTEVRFGTGDREKTVVGKVTAGLGAFAIHAEGSSRASDDYAVPRTYGSDRLRHSFAASSSYSAGASWVTSKGYLGAAYTRQTATYGLPGHSHANAACHTHRVRLHCALHGGIENPFADIDDSLPATIVLHSRRVDIRGDYDRLLPGMDHLRLRMSYTDYTQKEFDGGVSFNNFGNKVYDGRVEVTHQPLLGFVGTFGAQHTDGLFTGLDEISPGPKPFYRPNPYKTEDTGIFLTEKRSFGRATIEVAARKDWRHLGIVKDYYDPFGFAKKEGMKEHIRLWDISYAKYYPPSTVNPFSISLGANLDLDDGYSMAMSLARSERAPGVRELFARGNNLATNTFEVGLAKTNYYPDAKQPPLTNILETAKSLDLTLVKKGGKLEFDIGFFYKIIDDYIFARRIGAEPGHLFLFYTPADVRFMGLDGQVSYRLDARSKITLFGDYVDTRLRNELPRISPGPRASLSNEPPRKDNLPRLPPGRLGVRYAFADGPMTADVEYSRTMAQNRLALYETRTAGYGNLNATVAYRLGIAPGKSVEFYARGSNLGDEFALAHTSFVKKQSPLRGRNIVFGMRHSF